MKLPYRNIYTTTTASKPWKNIWIDGVKTQYEIHKKKGVRNINTHKKIKLGEHGNYLKYSFYLGNNKNTLVLAHRLYASIFIPVPDELKDVSKTMLDVNHKDGNGHNNEPWNLEWCTQQENVLHAFRTGLTTNFGETACLAKTSNKKVIEICELLQAGGKSIIEIAKIANVNPRRVRSIYQREAWNFISKDYDFSKVKMQNVDDDKIHKACKMLEGNKYSDKEIGEACGLTRRYVNDLRNHRTRLDISKDYHFSSDVVETNDEIRARQICGLLQEGKLTIPEIAKKFNITPQAVYDIRNGVSHANISKEFNITKPKPRLITDDILHEICKLLEESKTSQKGIARQLNVSVDTVRDIRLKKRHTDISKNYNF